MFGFPMINLMIYVVIAGVIILIAAIFTAGYAMGEDSGFQKCRRGYEEAARRQQEQAMWNQYLTALQGGRRDER